MKNLSTKLLTALIITALFMGTFSFASVLSPSELALQQGEEFGVLMGTMDGELAAIGDFGMGLSSNSRRTLPTDAALISKYQLNKDSNQYQTTFLRFYKLAYDAGYQSKFRELSLSLILSPLEQGAEHGALAGEVEGGLGAVIDLTQGLSNDWNRAYTRYIRGGSIRNRFFLSRESTTYQMAFESGFKDAFKNTYIESYRTMNVETELRNINLKTLGMLEDTITFEEEYIHVISGALESEIRTPLSLITTNGAVYEPTPVQMYKVQNTFNPTNNGRPLKAVSSRYVITIPNTNQSILLEKPIELSFDYYGSEYAGIYQWKNNRWEYQYTVLEDDRIYTTIPAGVYAGGEYAIFIDLAAVNMTRASHHWARNEVYTLMRRGAIATDTVYAPSAQITRAEFAELIYKSLGDNLRTPRAVSISDSAAFSNRQRAVEYVVGSRIMTLDANGAFNPNAPMTFEMFENALGSVLRRNVSWDDVAKVMLHEKYVRSAGLTNKQSAMTKAEAAFGIVNILR